MIDRDPTDNNSQSNVTDAADLYTQDRGAQYYAQRETLRSDETQRERASFFADIADETAVILDFGCGNGGILAQLRAAKWIGVEISPYAVNDARERLDLVVAELSQLDDQSIDIAISFHALEHVMHPAMILQAMHRVLKSAGCIRIVVPCDMPLLSEKHRRWRAQDTNMHLYGWTPLTLGNLLTVCGFEVEDTKIVPDSGGGRLGRMLAPENRLRAALAHRKALMSGRYHTVVTAYKHG